MSESIEKKIDLNKPEDCRWYIDHAVKTFLTFNGSPTTYIKTDTGRTLHFDKLTDAEAIDVANMIYSDIQLETTGGLS